MIFKLLNWTFHIVFIILLTSILLYFLLIPLCSDMSSPTMKKLYPWMGQNEKVYDLTISLNDGTTYNYKDVCYFEPDLGRVTFIANGNRYMYNNVKHYVLERKKLK